jgi:hypothetical protein
MYPVLQRLANASIAAFGRQTLQPVIETTGSRGGLSISTQTINELLWGALNNRSEEARILTGLSDKEAQNMVDDIQMACRDWTSWTLNELADACILVAGRVEGVSGRHSAFVEVGHIYPVLAHVQAQHMAEIDDHRRL